MAQDYNQTLNLPATEFPMRGNLPQREPAQLEEWESSRIYDQLVEATKGAPSYILHDGPPYANGDIHLGTALNKVLKDIIVKSKSMEGHHAVYVPGWDTHGLPIELKAMKKIGAEGGKLSPLEVRKHCHEFAMTYVQTQRKQFERLGVWGDFDNPYLTLRPAFEAKQIEIFGEMAKRDFIYKGLKPVYWCPECQTAIAEAEIEYQDDPCASIYVRFNVADDKGKFSAIGLDPAKVSFVIWTTTTWTLPGNLAICLGPEYEYTVVVANGEGLVMAKELVPAVMEAAGITEYETKGSFLGKELEGMATNHPFLPRQSPIIVGDHVTLESGTGCVHTAPGHGVEDFEVCQHYPEIGIVVPVDNKGVLTEEAGPLFAGLSTEDANKAIGKHLEETGNLFKLQRIVHQYPHCWRCGTPVLFRATEQWFCSVDGFKDEAIKAIEDVKWIPGWGEERIKNMVRDRSDWCISRQRVWGVPIPILYGETSGKPVINETTIKAIADLFRARGSDAWYDTDPKDFLPEGFTSEHGDTSFRKETDIMDVWFDSGSSHAAVLDVRDDLTWPADLYLEGADQYRGWFQSSLLTAVAWRGKAPYKAVCTHGWVVDGEGRKQSKSLGNGIDPDEIIKQYGADILRLWVASGDYHSDIRISKDILKQLSEAYRKIRNTARFILGNLTNGKGFNPDTDMVPDDELTALDRYALMKLDELIDEARAGYDSFDFHIVYHAAYAFCVTDMSNFYLDIIKDRLYCEREDAPVRRAAQTTMYRVLSALTRMLAPILAFTADEIWKHLPRAKGDDARSVVFNRMPEKSAIVHDDAFVARWDRIAAVREDVKKALEIKRVEKLIGAALEAKVTLHAEGELYTFLSSLSDELATVFLVSAVAVKEGGEGTFKGEYEGLSVTVEKAPGEKCERCWTYSETVGQDAEHPGLCSRCVRVLRGE